MTLDSHQHFWSYDEREYPWIPKGTPLHQDWLPEDLAALQRPLGIDGSIAVQARQTLEDSRWLLTLAEHDPRIKGVVGWVDLRSPSVDTQLAELAKHSRFRGVRHVVQDEDERFMQGAEFRRGVASLKAYGVTYDILIRANQLPSAIELVREFPNQPFVVDHIAKPPIKTGQLEPWNTHLRELARTAPTLMCKVSGVVTEADHRAWKPSELRPYLDVVFEAFGPERLMWGSDWPVCLLAASYKTVFEIVQEYARALSATQRAALFGGNCARFYGVL